MIIGTTKLIQFTIRCIRLIGLEKMSAFHIQPKVPETSVRIQIERSTSVRFVRQEYLGPPSKVPHFDWSDP